MTGARVQITVEDRRVQEGLGELAGKLGDLRPVFREVAGVLADVAFATESDPSTLTPWQRLAESTVRQHAEEGTWPGKILQRSGQLAASFSTDYGDDFASVGSNLAYAAIHQLGGEAGRGHSVRIAPRPPMGLPDEVLEICGRYLLGGLGGPFWRFGAP